MQELRKFILGEVNEVERQTIEERLMTNDAYFEELTILEEEVLQDFVNEKLSADEKQKFEKHFLCTKENHQKLKFALAMNKIAEEQPTQKKQTFFSSLLAFFMSPVPALGAILIVGGIIGFFVWKNYKGQSEVLVALNKERWIESRISDLNYKSFETTRGSDDKKIDLDINSAELHAIDAVRQNPSAENLHELGRVYLAKRNFEEAIKNLEEAKNKNDNIAKIHNDLGVAYLEKGKKIKEEFEKETKQNLINNDEKTLYLLLLGNANEEFAKAIELDKNLLEAYFNQALCIELKGLPDETKDAWENYLKLDSNSKWAEEAKTHLKELEKKNNSISKTKGEVLQDFLQAKESNDKEASWEILSQNRSVSSGKLIPQQLAFLFIESSLSNETAKAKEYLNALIYAGNIEEEKSGDLFWRDLANYYKNVSKEDLIILKQAKDIYFQTMLAENNTVKNGEYEKSVAQLKESKKNYLEVNNSLEPKIIDFLLGYLLNRDAKIDESNKVLESIADFCKKSNYKWLETQANTWLVLNRMGERKFSQAEVITKRSLDLAIDTNDLLSQQKSFSLFSEIYFLMGQYEKSFINIQKNIWLGKLPNASAGERWRALNAISRYFFSLEKYNTSLVFGKEALTLAEKLGDPTWTFTSLIDLSVVNSALGNYDEALNLIEKGEKFTETLKDSNYKNKCIAHINLQLGNINRQKHLYSEAIENYQKASDFYDSGKFQVNGYESHVGSLLSSIASKNEIGIESELPKILEIFKIYRKEIIEEQNRNSFFNNEQDVYDIATDYEFEKNNFEKAFDYTEESRSRSLLDLQYSLAEVSTEEKTPVIKFSKNLTEPFKLSDIQNQMPANTQLLVYSVLPEKTLIWIITKDSIDTAKTQISSEVLQEKIVNYLKLIEKHDELNNQLTSSKELYQILILPIKDKLDKNKQIVIIPDKILFRLPFDTLYSDKYFLEDYTISYSPSANVFLNCTNKAKGFDLGNSETLLSIGNPHFKVNEYKNLEDLPSAKDEAKEIAPLYKNSKILVENQATKEAFKANLQNADVIHFAGHYIVEEKNSLLSSLVLAGETKEESDLANYEIISENFSQTRLIILSACETGIETYYNGEGMMGASRTFLAKNVPLVIASQWKVETKASKKLMVHFHQLRKNEKLSTAEALRQAQLTMLKEENYNQPYYWAAFTTLGGYAQF